MSGGAIGAALEREVAAGEALAATSGEMLAEAKRESEALRERLRAAEQQCAEWRAGVVAANRISQDWSTRGEDAERKAAELAGRLVRLRRQLCGDDQALFESPATLEDLVAVMMRRS